VKVWLFDDPEGLWERRASELLEQASTHPAFPSLSNEEVDAEVSTALAYLALEAMRRSQQRPLLKLQRAVDQRLSELREMGDT